MTNREALDYLYEIDKKTVKIGHIMSLLSWDMETIMPASAIEERSEQMGIMSEISHNMAVNDKNKEALELAKTVEDLTDVDKALIRNWDKFFKTNANLPLEFVVRESEAQAKAHSVWVKAREKDDFSIFAPMLQELIDLSKEKASYIDKSKPVYDVLLDMFEEGMNQSIIDPLFDELEEIIHNLLDKIGDKEIESSFMFEPYDKDKLHEFCLDVYSSMGFDKKRNLVGLSDHPFTTTLGVDDVRLTTRYTDASLSDPVSSMMHEAGHALYDSAAALNRETRGTSLASGVSMGIHESQSRYWENLIGRSYSFWTFYYPKLQERFSHLKDVPLDKFVKGLNKVQPSAIRINADELTYSLHIILRYRMEKAIFTDNVSVDKLPSLWNEMSKKIIRYCPKNNSEGILQDVHWSAMLFGYFPTYALGNLYGAMFYNKMNEDLEGVDKILENGEFEKITEWQRDNIWHHGAIYQPKTLLKMVTDRSLCLDDFKAYLYDKFSRIYNIEEI